MIAYYREQNGDFLAIDTTTNRYYRDNFGQDHFEGRATATIAQVEEVAKVLFPNGTDGLDQAEVLRVVFRYLKCPEATAFQTKKVSQ